MTTLQVKLSNEDRALAPDLDAIEDPAPYSEGAEIEGGTAVRSDHADGCWVCAVAIEGEAP